MLYIFVVIESLDICWFVCRNRWLFKSDANAIVAFIRFVLTKYSAVSYNLAIRNNVLS